MNAVLSKLLTSGRVVTPTGETIKLHSHLPQMEGEIMQAWIRQHRPQRLLEIGLAYGLSSLFICDALQPIGHTAYHIMDPHQRTHWRSLGLLHLQRAGYQDQFVFHEEPSELCLPQLLKDGAAFDFALIDGFHTFDHTMIDFFYVNRMLEINGIVIIDDLQYPAIQRMVSFINSLGCYRPLAIPGAIERERTFRVRKMMGVPGARVVGFQKTAADERRWDWYENF